MIRSPPRFRTDLIVSQQRMAGATVLIVKDPASGAFYRLGEAEYFIARQFDGTTPLETIRRRTEATFDATLPDDALGAFVRSLERAGLLETTEEGRESGKAGR